jgi:hypothetical protein
MIRPDQGRAAELQRELRDLLWLAVVGNHLRWVVIGDDGQLASWLSDAVPKWRALADEVAMHLVTLGVPPDGRVRALAKDIPLHWVPDGWLSADEAKRLITERLHAVASFAQQRRLQATDGDSGRLLEAVRAGLARTP